VRGKAERRPGPTQPGALAWSMPREIQCEGKARGERIWRKSPVRRPGRVPERPPAARGRRTASPADVESEGHHAIDEVVPGGDGVEHGADQGRLLRTVGRSLDNPAAMSRSGMSPLTVETPGRGSNSRPRRTPGEPAPPDPAVRSRPARQARSPGTPTGRRTLRWAVHLDTGLAPMARRSRRSHLVTWSSATLISVE